MARRIFTAISILLFLHSCQEDKGVTPDIEKLDSIGALMEHGPDKCRENAC